MSARKLGLTLVAIFLVLFVAAALSLKMNSSRPPSSAEIAATKQRAADRAKSEARDDELIQRTLEIIDKQVVVYVAKANVDDSRRLIITVQIEPSHLGNPQATAEKILLAVRNSMVGERVFNSYRVTLEGPPPGPGLIRRYGSLRFIEGGAMEWSKN